jgi:hypothetical protein
LAAKKIAVARGFLGQGIIRSMSVKEAGFMPESKTWIFNAQRNILPGNVNNFDTTQMWNSPPVPSRVRVK